MCPKCFTFRTLVDPIATGPHNHVPSSTYAKFQSAFRAKKKELPWKVSLLIMISPRVGCGQGSHDDGHKIVRSVVEHIMYWLAESSKISVEERDHQRNAFGRKTWNFSNKNSRNQNALLDGNRSHWENLRNHQTQTCSLEVAEQVVSFLREPCRCRNRRRLHPTSKTRCEALLSTWVF